MNINEIETSVYYNEMFTSLAEAEAHIAAKESFSESDCSCVYKFVYSKDIEFKKEAIRRYPILFNHIAHNIVHIGFSELLFYRLYFKECPNTSIVYNSPQPVIIQLFKGFESKQLKDFYGYSRYYLTELNSFINENESHITNEYDIALILQSYLFKILKNIDLTKYFYIEKFIKELENAYANR